MTEVRTNDGDEPIVPDDVIPHGTLPPLRERDLPEPVSWRAMVGPSIILAGLALGSGEFVLWPYIVHQSGFVFIWACLLGVVTQFFLNMEIERWTLATGESAITGFCRLSRHWAWVFLLMNVVPWAFPGWATGAATLFGWLVWGPVESVAADGTVTFTAHYANLLGVVGLVAAGLVLTAGPVVYNTVETLQTILVGFILVAIVVMACLVVRWDAVVAFAEGALQVGRMPPESSGLALMTLLGALAFAGAGGTLNLGQSNYVKDKGYGMGAFIGRITSPVTGQEEATADVGYHFPHTEENLRRWRGWWRAANLEHFLSFFLTCLVCLVLMTLIAYSLLYDENGDRVPAAENLGSGLAFIWGQATLLADGWGGRWRNAYLWVGIAVLMTTEIGILDVITRVSTDLVKVNFLRESTYWSQSRLYFLFLWGQIGLGTFILLGTDTTEPLLLFKLSASLNGVVMFVYSLLLLYTSSRVLPKVLRASWPRVVALVWSSLFFGYFSWLAIRLDVWPKLFGE